jgi:hypothetical protein
MLTNGTPGYSTFKPTWAEWQALYAVANRMPAARPVVRRLVKNRLVIRIKDGAYALAPGVMNQMVNSAPRNKWVSLRSSYPLNVPEGTVFPTAAPTIEPSNGNQD